MIIKNFNYKKRYGQNFIYDINIINKIISYAGIDKNTLVIEIGVGAAKMTNQILNLCGFLIGYEIDNTLEPIIEEELKSKNNKKIIYDDFLKRIISEDIKNIDYKRIVVVSNLPYYITTPIIQKLIDDGIKIEKMVLMVQKEVADRFCAVPNTREYNSLTIFLNYYFNIKRVMSVPKEVFTPRPKVDSTVLLFETKDSLEEVINKEIFFKLIRDSFKQKRKTLRNNLKSYNLEIIDSILKKNNKSIQLRAEAITISEFIEISNSISK